MARALAWQRIPRALCMCVTYTLLIFLVEAIELPYLSTVGMVRFWCGKYRPAQYNLSAPNWIRRHRPFFSVARLSTATVCPAVVTHAAGRQTGKRPVQRSGSSSSSSGDDGDGGGDGGGEPPHRVRLTPTPEYVGGVA
jgi:uncharacterized membrane protein YgcG